MIKIEIVRDITAKEYRKWTMFNRYLTLVIAVVGATLAVETKEIDFGFFCFSAAFIWCLVDVVKMLRLEKE